MATKADKERQGEEAAAQTRQETYEAAQERLTHMVDPLTDPSSGNPPHAISPQGDRMGSAEMTPAVDDPVAKDDDAAEKKERAAEARKEKAAEAKAAEKKADAAAAKAADKPSAPMPHAAPAQSSPSWMPPFGQPKDSDKH